MREDDYSKLLSEIVAEFSELAQTTNIILLKVLHPNRRGSTLSAITEIIWQIDQSAKILVLKSF